MHKAFRAVVHGGSFGTLMLISGCILSTGNEYVRVLGVIVPSPSYASRVITAPDTVSAGATFTVSVSSFGSSSCTRPDGATVSVVGLVATISVWDREQIGGACTADLRPFPRDVSLRIPDRGRLTILVQGRAYPRATNGPDSVIYVEKQVVVE